MRREIRKIAEHLNELYMKGRYDPMKPENLPFCYKDLEDWCKDNERDFEYIDPSEYGSCAGHYADEQMYPIDDFDDEEE